MLITERVAELASSRSGDLTVKELCIGVGYTGVVLSDGRCGIAYTVRNSLGSQCGIIEEAGSLRGMSARDAIKMAMSINLARASIGIATINAILNTGYEPGQNAIDAMDVHEGDVIGTIGYFHPVMNKFSPKAKEVKVFERNLTEPGLYPDWAENIYLPQCDVVVITGVTFINKTIDHVLSLSKNAKEIVVMGGSVCMAPEIMKEYGVTVLAGSSIVDAGKMMQLIAEGGGGIEVQNYVQKLCVRLAPRRA